MLSSFLRNASKKERTFVTSEIHRIDTSLRCVSIQGFSFVCAETLHDVQTKLENPCFINLSIEFL